MTEHAVPHHRSLPGKWIAGAAIAVFLIAAIAVASRFLSSPTPVPVPVATLPPRPVEARGKIVPVTWASVSPTIAGRVAAVYVREGSQVEQRQELLRIEGDTQTVSVLAPFKGTVALVTTREGETLLPGQQALIIGDLTRWAVETTDLNEFGAARVKVGQRADLTIESLDLTTQGIVRTVALMGQTNSSGDVTYKSTVDIDLPDPRVRWGMSVLVRFEDS